MTVETSLAGLAQLPPRCLVAIGVFDGVHQGHRAILREMVEAGRERGLRTAALTFEPHPLEILFPGTGPARLTSLAERSRLMAGLGVDHVVVVPFDRRLAGLTPDEFVTGYLLSGCRPEQVFVGFNFTFGRSGAGTASTLAELGRKHGFAVRVVPPVVVEGFTVSSTLIRELVSRGNVHTAAALLGRPFRLAGQVISGDGLGRILGFPTANVSPEEGLVIPGSGVYAATVVAGGTHPAVVNIGVRPTLGGRARRLEAHLLDFRGRLYGSWVEILFVARLRDETAFPDLESLRGQIARDVERARLILAGGPAGDLPQGGAVR